MENDDDLIKEIKLLCNENGITLRFIAEGEGYCFYPPLGRIDIRPYQTLNQIRDSVRNYIRLHNGPLKLKQAMQREQSEIGDDLVE